MKKWLIVVLLMTFPLAFGTDWHFAKPEYDYWTGTDKISHFGGSFIISGAWYWDETLGHPDRQMNKTKAHLMSIGGTLGIGLVKEIVDGFHYKEGGKDGFSWRDLVCDASGAVVGSYTVDLLAHKKLIGPYQGFQVFPSSEEPWDMTHFEEGFLSAGAVIFAYNVMQGGRFGDWSKEKSEVIATLGVLGIGTTLEVLNGINMFPSGNKFSWKDMLGKVTGVAVGYAVIHFVGAPWTK